MVPTSFQDTNDLFPLPTERISKCYEYFKGTCSDFFFDYLTGNMQAGLGEISSFF